MELDFRHLFTEFDGRINRAKWWAGAGILFAFWYVVNGIFGGFTIGAILVFLFTFPVFYFAYAVSAKRFQDRGRAGITALYGLVPLLIAVLFGIMGLTGDATASNAVGWICNLVILGVGLWFVIDLGLLKGTPGPNAFGGDPLVAVG
jgi:uncharacterized membrane protein YhaH (DUF805 family)